jgi:hypothetical protein
MRTKKFFLTAIAAGFVLSSAAFSFAQDATSQTPATAQASPDPQQQQEEKAKLERKATALLEQVISEAQALKLPENRIRVQIAAGAMLWEHNQARARDQFTNAGAAIAQMSAEADRNDREEMQTVNQLRQDLVLTVGRKDADLAYQLLHTTQSQTANTNTGNGRRFMPDQQTSLEQSLLSIVAATDPKYAYQKAVESLDKNEYPTSVGRVLAQLQDKDKEAFDKLTTKVLGKLTPDTLMASREADGMALGLLRPGPRPDQPASNDASGNSTSNSTSTNTANSANAPVSNQVLTPSAYHDLLDATVTAALNAQRPAPGSTMGNVAVINGGGPGGRGFRAPQVVQSNPPDEAQVQQNNTRALLMNMQMMLPQIDQYLPDRAQVVRQKLTEFGLSNNMMNYGQMANAMRTNTSESLMNAASVAPPQIQPRLYQQAAQKAIDEGDTDRAVQIANDHLEESARTSIMQAVDFKRAAINMSGDKLNEIRQKLAALPSDTERVKYLLDLSTATQKDNPKLSLRFLDDARNLVSKKAAGYSDFEDQLKVAAAYAPVDPKRSFDVLEPGIAQLNELLSAAQVLNGFEVEVFRDGELPIQGGSELGAMVTRYGQQLASLAKLDFDRARMTADKFLLPEPRLLTKLSIVQGVFGVQPFNNDNSRRFQNFNFVVR